MSFSVNLKVLALIFLVFSCGPDNQIRDVVEAIPGAAANPQEETPQESPEEEKGDEKAPDETPEEKKKKCIEEDHSELTDEELDERRCENGEVALCHQPIGNPAEKHIIFVGSDRAFIKHMNHGELETQDYVLFCKKLTPEQKAGGDCPPKCPPKN